LIWDLSNRAADKPRALADRHYSRQKVGARQFVPPGRCVVLYAEDYGGEAYWVSSWPFPEYVKHAWAGAWMCSAFRTEGLGPASAMIREAIAASRAVWGDPPALGMVTFVDRDRVRPTKVRGRDVWGWTYRRAGFVEVGETKAGLLALQLAPQDFPAAAAPRGWQGSLVA
jgi:hypothetical protein